MLAAFAVVHIISASYYGTLIRTFKGAAGEVVLMKNTLGRVLATMMPLCSRLVFCICAAPLILATAGYVFNEVFVYWFPNLGFSFCLLALLLSINIAGEGFSDTAQLVFVASALMGLSILILIGLTGLEGLP